MHKTNVRARQRDLAKLRRQVEERREENRQLDRQLMEQQVAVLEREAVENLAGQCMGWSACKDNYEGLIIGAVC